MSRKRFSDINCSIAQSLDQIGDWWSLLIVREAFLGITTFSLFESRLGIAKNILSRRLEQLVEEGVLERTQIRPDVERFEYHLTEKGQGLMPVLVALMQWGDRWVFGEGNEPFAVVDAIKREPIGALTVTDAKGREVATSDLRFLPGPGANEVTLRNFEEARARRRARATP